MGEDNSYITTIMIVLGGKSCVWRSTVTIKREAKRKQSKTANGNPTHKMFQLLCTIYLQQKYTQPHAK